MEINKEKKIVVINGEGYNYSPELPKIDELRTTLDALEEIEQNIVGLNADSDTFEQYERTVQDFCEDFYGFSGAQRILNGKAVPEDRYVQFWDLLEDIKAHFERLKNYFGDLSYPLHQFAEVDVYNDSYEDIYFWMSDEILTDFENGIIKRKLINWETQVHSGMSSDLHGKTEYTFVTITDDTYNKAGRYKLIHFP